MIPVATRKLLRRIRRYRTYISDRIHDRSNQPKIFGLGLSRTGTTSLTGALCQMGFDVIHYPLDERTIRERMAGVKKWSLLSKCDGVTDITTIPFYQELDETYPGSKFILTVRDKTQWLDSLESLLVRDSPKDEADRYPGRPDIPPFRRFLRERVYGTNEFDRQKMSETFDRHNQEVISYFESRPEDLLVLDIVGGDPLSRLCDFLSQPGLDGAFPKLNASPEDSESPVVPKG